MCLKVVLGQLLVYGFQLRKGRVDNALLRHFDLSKLI